MEAVANFFNGIASNLTNIASNVQASLDLSVTLDSTAHEKTLTVKRGTNGNITLPVYKDYDDISGVISVSLNEAEKYEHLGLKCFLIGYLEIYGEEALSTEFMLTSKELQPAGFLTQDKSWKFKFSHFDKQYETFRGTAGQVRYFIRAQLNRNVIGPVTQEQEFAVLKMDDLPKAPQAETVLNVGVDDKLHIEFRLQKNSYHLKEWVCGTVTFHTVKMPVTKMEISVVRRQSLGTPDSTTSRSKVLTKFEVMDGCPDQGETIPFRICMSGVKHLSPSYSNIHNRLFVRHWFSVTIFDQNNHRFFKQAEITFHRKAQ